MQTPEVKANTEKFIHWFRVKYQQGELDNESILEFFKVGGTYLNLETIPDYAERTGMSYQGVKVGRRIEEIFGVKFVIHNE